MECLIDEENPQKVKNEDPVSPATSSSLSPVSSLCPLCTLFESPLMQIAKQCKYLSQKRKQSKKFATTLKEKWDHSSKLLEYQYFSCPVPVCLYSLFIIKSIQKKIFFAQRNKNIEHKKEGLSLKIKLSRFISSSQTKLLSSCEGRELKPKKTEYGNSSIDNKVGRMKKSYVEKDGRMGICDMLPVLPSPFSYSLFPTLMLYPVCGHPLHQALSYG